MITGEVLINQIKEIFSSFSADILTVRWIEPNNVSFSLFFVVIIIAALRFGFVVKIVFISRSA